MLYMVTFTINIPPMLAYMHGSIWVYISGWWLSHPSEKYESQWGGLSIHIMEQKRVK